MQFFDIIKIFHCKYIITASVNLTLQNNNIYGNHQIKDWKWYPTQSLRRKKMTIKWHKKKFYFNKNVTITIIQILTEKIKPKFCTKIFNWIGNYR